MSNETVAHRLATEIELFRIGQRSLEEVQAALMGHGQALEGLGGEWHRLVLSVDAELEHIRFIIPHEEQRGPAAAQLGRITLRLSELGLMP